MLKFRKLITSFCCLLVIIPAFSQGYELKVKINGLSDSSLILGHYLSKSMYPDDTIRLDHKGFGTFKGSRMLPGGIYIIFLPSSNYFEIIIGDDQSFSIEVDTTNFLQTLKIQGSDENQIFLDFQKYMFSLRRQADSLTQLIRKESDLSSRNLLSEKLRKINEARINEVHSITEKHPDLFVSSFLKATLDISVPDPPKDEKGNVLDSTWQYYYYRTHYFDNFNIADPRMLRTPLYEDKIITYITKVVPQLPDSLIPEIDYLIETSKADSSLFRYMLITLFNYYGKSNIMGMDAVQVHIADKYYIHESWWSDEKFITDLKDRVEKTKPLLIGAVAPDIELMAVPGEHFRSAANDSVLKRNPHVGTKITLHNTSAKYTVLIFWEAECGHCKIAVPELYKIYQSSLKNLGVKVLAVSTLFGEDGKIEWVDFVNEKGIYDWINVWNPYSYDFKLKYDIQSTPQIFILDQDKKIIAKKVSPEQVGEIINTLIK